ncbi:Pex19 protein, partial [Blyttiomyces helicus]
APSAAPATFQEKISQTMNKLRDSSDKAEPPSPFGDFDDPAMAQMMKELEGLMGTGDLDGVLEGVMEQMLSKELLQEPLKELAGKYPTWLADNESKVPEEDMVKYRKQLSIIEEILAIYDRSGSAQPTSEESKRVVELMQQMQDCGNPPAEIWEELAPGM